jgi:hypothetical protein
VTHSFSVFFAVPAGLTGVEPFALLAEMGAEKLRRDYIAVFVTYSLATPSALANFTDTEAELPVSGLSV